MNRFINFLDDHWEWGAAVGVLLSFIHLVTKG